MQNWMTTVLGLFMSRKQRSRRTNDRDDLIKLLGRWYEKFREVMEIKIPGETIAKKEAGLGRPDVGSDRKTAFDSCYHEQCKEFRFNKLLKEEWWPCLVFSRVEKFYSEMCERPEKPDVTSGGATRESQLRFSHEETQHDGTAIRCEWGNNSWKIGETRCWSSKRGKTSTICHWKRWNRSRIVSGIKIIREPREWSSTKMTETNFKCYRKWRETFYYMENVHGKELPKQLSFHCEHDRSHKQMFDLSTRLVFEQDEISGLETFCWENFSWKYLSLTVDESYQSSTHEGPRLFGFCIVSW